MRFAYPFALMLLLILPPLAVLAVLLRRRVVTRLSGWGQGTDAAEHRRMLIQGALMLAGMALLIVALARPQWGKKDELVTTRGRNLMIAIDVSRSMLAQDVRPNRLERAKADVIDLIDDLQGDRAGLIAFRKTGVVLCPLTTDYAFLRQSLDALSIASAPAGETGLADAISKALAAFDEADARHNAIILISDGEDLAGHAREAAETAGKRGIPIFTVGIGDTAGATIPDSVKSGNIRYQGADVKSRLTEATLSAIAKASGGHYIPLATAGTAHTTLGTLYRKHLRQIADREQQERFENQIRERYALFLIPGILLILAAGALSSGRLATRRRTIAALLVLAFACPLHAENETEDSLEAPPPATEADEAIDAVPTGYAGAREAQDLYRKGKFEEAARAYTNAALGAEYAEAARFHFNAALAWLKAEKTEEAAALLRPLMSENTAVAAPAATLLGKIRYAAAEAAADDPEKRFAEREAAVEAFQIAARLNPADQTARNNLTRALNGLETLRTEAREARVMREHEKTPPQQLLTQLLTGQRDLMKTAPAIFTNAPAERITLAEAAAEALDNRADLWLPLQKTLLSPEAITNEEQRVELIQRSAINRAQLQGIALALRDLAPVENEAAEPEPFIYTLWRAAAEPPALIDEAIAVQTNALTSTTSYMPSRPDQPEVASLNRQFGQIFPEWADQVIQQRQSDTNAIPFTAEDKAKIEALSREIETLTQPPAIMGKLEEIRALLPKDKSQSSSNQQQQQQQQQNQQQQQQEEKQEQQQNQQQQQEQKQEEQNEPPRDVKELLRRALDREREHEEKKNKNAIALPTRPDERDW